VDHQLVRNAALGLLADGRRWVMPGPDYADHVAFYEDFPYAWWGEFSAIEDLPEGSLAGLPRDLALEPFFADITDVLERKITGINLYESQIERLFAGTTEMADAVRSYGLKVAGLGGVDGFAERYWNARRA
jgi:LmbE family N-acetylglucosaminyl deacetylase